MATGAPLKGLMVLTIINTTVPTSISCLPSGILLLVGTWALMPNDVSSNDRHLKSFL